MQRGNFIGEYDSLSLIHFYDAWRLHPVLTTLEDYISELPLLSKLQRMLDRWQALPPNERPIDQHPSSHLLPKGWASLAIRTRWTSSRCLVCGATAVDCNGGRRGRTTFKYVTGKVTITKRVGKLSTGA